MAHSLVSSSQRIGAATVAGACLAMLVVGAWLTPDASGHGTHMQLGLPECGWAAVLGRPCPTCGMTTAVSGVAHGNLAGAIQAQPMGALLGLASATLFWLALHSAVTGSRTWEMVLGGFLQPAVLWGLAAGGGLAWGYKLLTWTG